MNLNLTCYTLSGTIVARGRITDVADLATAWRVTRRELVGHPFGGTATVAAVTPRKSIHPRGYRDQTKWATVLDADGCEIGRAAIVKSDLSTFAPNR